jgi:hypothetical protein
MQEFFCPFNRTLSSTRRSERFQRGECPVADSQEEQQAPLDLLLGRDCYFTVYIAIFSWSASEQHNTHQEWNKYSKNNMYHWGNLLHNTALQMRNIRLLPRRLVSFRNSKISRSY